MKIPDKIKIGGHIYSIVPNPTCVMDDGMAAMGVHKGAHEKIEINSGYPVGVQASTLLHEVIEAVNWLNELGLEHRQISSLEEGLYQVLHDNKLHFDEQAGD